MKGADLYVALSLLTALLSAWYVGASIRHNAAATQDLASAMAQI